MKNEEEKLKTKWKQGKQGKSKNEKRNAMRNAMR